MKLLKSIVFLSVFTIGLIANTDKKNIEVVETLYEKVILKDIEIAINDATKLKKELENKNTQKVKEKFSELVGSWKSVESFYILGDLDEEYIDTISNSKFLLTTSIQSCLESIACGNKPVLLLRKDKSYNLQFIENLNLPTINYNENLDKMIIEFEDIISSYPNLNDIEIFDFNTLVLQIRKKFSPDNNINS